MKQWLGSWSLGILDIQKLLKSTRLGEVNKESSVNNNKKRGSVLFECQPH